MNMWDAYDQEQREKANADYISAECFNALEQEALRRGFRKATIAEINRSANSRWTDDDLHCWKGGLWVKIEAKS